MPEPHGGAWGLVRGALASELFDGSLSQLSGTSPFAYTASLTNLIPDTSNAGLLLAGQMSPVILLALDQADRHSVPAISAIASLSGQAAGFFGNSINLMGEDVFNAEGKLDRRKLSLASLSAQDWLRIAISIGLLLGAILKWEVCCHETPSPADCWYIERPGCVGCYVLHPPGWRHPQYSAELGDYCCGSGAFGGDCQPGAYSPALHRQRQKRLSSQPGPCDQLSCDAGIWFTEGSG